MNIIPYVNRPAPFAWDVAAAIFGASGLEGGLYDPSDLNTLFQNVAGTIPSLPGDPVGLVLDKSGNGNDASQPTAAARPTLARMPLTGRRNLMDISEPTVATVTVGGTSGIVDAAGFAQFSHSINFPKVATTIFAYVRPSDAVSGTVATLSAFVAMDDGLPPTFGSSTVSAAANDFFLNLGNAASNPLTYVVAHMGGGIYRVSVTGTLGSNLNNTGIVRYATNSDRDFRATGYQLEAGSTLTHYQKVTNAYDVTEAGVPDTYDLTYDLTDDALSTTFPTTITGDILIAGRNGSIIEPFSGDTLTIGPDTYTGGIPGILSAIGGIVGVLVIDRSLTQAEKDQLIRYYKGKGAKGLLVPGPELLVNGTFDTDTAWSRGPGWVIEDGLARHSGGTAGYINQGAPIEGRVYIATIDVVEANGSNFVQYYLGEAPAIGLMLAPGLRVFIAKPRGTALGYALRGVGAAAVDAFSVRELRAEEDWT